MDRVKGFFILTVTFLINKSFRLATLLFAVCLLSFILISYSPVDPIQAYIGADMMRVGPEQREQITEAWGLDKNPAQQFISWSSSVLRGI